MTTRGTDQEQRAMPYDEEASRRRRQEQRAEEERRVAELELRDELARLREPLDRCSPADFDPDYVPTFRPVPAAFWPAIAKLMVDWMAELRTRDLLSRLDDLDRCSDSAARTEAIRVYRMAAAGDAAAVAARLQTILHEWDKDFWPEFQRQWRGLVPQALVDPPPPPDVESPPVPVAEPKTRMVPVPETQDFQLWKLCKYDKYKQVDAADVYTQRTGIPMVQGQVSRAVTKVRRWLDAGNVLPDIEPLPPPKVHVVNPKVIDWGQREDGRTPRQRSSHGD